MINSQETTTKLQTHLEKQGDQILVRYYMRKKREQNTSRKAILDISAIISSFQARELVREKVSESYQYGYDKRTTRKCGAYRNEGSRAMLFSPEQEGSIKLHRIADGR